MRDDEPRTDKAHGPARKPAPGVYVSLRERWSEPQGAQRLFGPYASVTVSSGADAAGGIPLLCGVDKAGEVTVLAALTAGLKWRPTDAGDGGEFGAVAIVSP